MLSSFYFLLIFNNIILRDSYFEKLQADGKVVPN